MTAEEIDTDEFRVNDVHNNDEAFKKAAADAQNVLAYVGVHAVDHDVGEAIPALPPGPEVEGVVLKGPKPTNRLGHLLALNEKYILMNLYL